MWRLETVFALLPCYASHDILKVLIIEGVHGWGKEHFAIVSLCTSMEVEFKTAYIETKYIIQTRKAI